MREVVHLVEWELAGTLKYSESTFPNAKRAPFQTGIDWWPIWERCLEEDESATHVLCDCEAIAYLRFHHLGQFFMEPSDYSEAPINKVLHFIQGVGLIEG
jgi:hypothetical protein